MKEISTAIDIDASAQEVWQVLTDFSSYSSWNPFIKQIAGTLVEGGRLTIVLKIPGTTKEMIFKPKIIKFDVGQEFRLSGPFYLSSLVMGEHCLKIIHLKDDYSRFFQGEYITGIWAGLVSKNQCERLKKVFELMNRALKRRVELLRNSN